MPTVRPRRADGAAADELLPYVVRQRLAPWPDAVTLCKTLAHNPRERGSCRGSTPVLHCGESRRQAAGGAAVVQVHEVESKSALNRVEGMPFRWGLNPYRGCSHGCR